MTKDDLEALPTKRLLARLKSLQQCEQSLALSDREAGESIPSEFIEFKESSKWIAEYILIKELLNERENIET